MSAPRLLMDQRLGPGVELDLDDAQSRHVVTVLRLAVGDQLLPFNGRDGEWSATITTITKRGAKARVGERIRPPHAVPDLDLLFAPVKRQATDLIVEKATELGVRRLRPVITQRTIAETVRLDRLNAIAREAAEQTERFDAPEIFEPVTLVRALDGWNAARPLIYCDEHGDAQNLLDSLISPSPRGEGAGRGVKRDVDSAMTQGVSLRVYRIAPPPIPLPSRGGGALSLVIGPEGGFTSEERAMLRACAFVVPVSLGPRILRAETAVIAALTIIQAAWGDWRDA
jgi:16S rRNA (uracil1498-N3)-methyltransferase